MNALTLAPVSPRAAELLHALYAETLAAAEASMNGPPAGAIVLSPHGACCHHRADATTAFAYFDNYSTRIRLHRLHGHPTQIWSGWEQRIDASGAQWERSMQAVVDNFGDLVEVPT